MSVLAYPRIHFQGRCLLNPATANNDDTMVEIDEARVEILKSLRDLDDPEARRWMFGGDYAISQSNGKKFFYLDCSWNYFGDASVRFHDARVTSTVGADGKPRCVDPIVGHSVRLLSKGRCRPVLCDVDPTGIAIAQLFVGGLGVGDPKTGLEVAYDTRAYSRWLVWRNTAIYPGEHSFARGGATWQFAIPNDRLADAKPTSPALGELLAAARKGQGIQVQFCFYLTRPGLSDAALQTLFHAGFEVPNPAEAYMVGTIGVWEAGELMTSMFDRLLQQPPGISFGSPLSNLGPASARLHTDRGLVSLNLISAFPEANYDRPPTQKADFGDVRLGLIPHGTDRPVAISDPIPYDNATYLKTGGIVDVPYDSKCASPKQIAKGTLVLLSDAAEAQQPGGATSPCQPHLSQPLLTEAGSIFTVETDDQAVYLDMEGENSHDISLIVRERGRPLSRDVTIWLWEYQFFVFPAEPLVRAHSRLLRLQPGVPLTSRIDFPQEVDVRVADVQPIKIKVTAKAAGSAVLAFTVTTGSTPTPPRIDFPLGAALYMAIRVLPKDEYPELKKGAPIDFDFMYKHVFRYYHMIFPAMSKIIPFDNAKAMEAAAQQIVDRTDPRIRFTPCYMPISRDLSPGKRRLILAWAAQFGAKPK